MQFEKNAKLMERVRKKIEDSPKRDIIRGVKKPIPTDVVDFETMMKEPEKIKHIRSIAKLKMKLLPVDHQRKKRKSFHHLKDKLLPVKVKRPKRKAPTPPSELDRLREKKLVSNSTFKK